MMYEQKLKEAPLLGKMQSDLKQLLTRPQHEATVTKLL